MNNDGAVDRLFGLQLLGATVDAIPQAVCVVDETRGVAFVNGAMSRLAGRNTAELLGQSAQALAQILSKAMEDSQEGLLACRKLLLGNGSQDLDIRFCDGLWRNLACHGSDDGARILIVSDVASDQVGVEESRHNSEMARLIVEACPLPIAISRLTDRKLIFESKANNLLFGETEEEKASHVGAYDVDPAQRVEYMERLRRDGEVSDFEIKFRRRDGTEFVGALSAQVLEFNGEDVVISVVVDVSERIEREATLRRILDVSPIPIAMYRLPDGEISYENTASRTLFGVYSQDSYKERYSRWTDQSERERIVDLIYERGAIDGMEVQFKQPDGNPFWGVISARLIEYRGEDVVIASIYDISQRKEMESALRDSEDLIRTILDTSPVPLNMIRVRDGEIIYESPVAQTTYQYSATTGYGPAQERWVNEDERIAYLERLHEDGFVDGMDVERRRGDGSTFQASLSSRLIEHRGEDVIVSAVFDLTERLAIEEEMALQREALHQSEKLNAMGHLLASVAHELNNPLSVVVGQSLLLQETTQDEKILKRAEQIGTAADRCARIVRTFLAMARHESRQKAPVGINDLLNDSHEVTRYAMRNAGIQVSLDLADGLPLVMADADQLMQVFTNLLVNADHALGEVEGARRLDISSRDDGNGAGVVVEIKDNGPGIPEAIRSRIFEPFFTTKKQGEGTGIGLALCHRVIEAHGGEIEVISAPGQGAAFVIRLPGHEEAAASDGQ